MSQGRASQAKVEGLLVLNLRRGAIFSTCAPTLCWTLPGAWEAMWAYPQGPPQPHREDRQASRPPPPGMAVELCSGLVGYKGGAHTRAAFSENTPRTFLEWGECM
jgi:hypothetical protein